MNTTIDKIENKTGEKLHCYASGNGALSFTFADKDGKATSRQVTFLHVKNYVNRKGNEYLKPLKIICLGGYYHLYTDVKRVDASNLSINGVEYSYNQQSSQHIDVFTEDEGKTRVVANISLKSSLLFYLNNEKEIIENEKSI